MRKGPGFLCSFERYPTERKLLRTRFPQVTKCLWKVQQSEMKFNIAVAISGSMYPTHSFLTCHKVTPVTSLGHTASFVEQKADRRLTFKAKEEVSDLPGALIFLQKHHQQTVPATALLCSGRTTVPGLSNSKYLLPLQTKEYVLCFTLLQKWLLEVKDTSFVKLPINKTVFTSVQMAAQRHGVAFAAPAPFTYHRNEEQIQVTTVSHWGRSKDIRSKSNLRNRMQEELIFRGSEYFLIFYPNYYNGQYLYIKTND